MPRGAALSVLPLYGFTLLRNGLKYDYPFRESLRSLCALCETVYVALGDSTDGTEAALAEFTNLKIIPSVWDETFRQSGLILSQQTNLALSALRHAHPEGWGIYLQADEAFDPAEFAQLREDLVKAEVAGCDAVSFRYLHFWQRYDEVLISRRAYPQEIRAIRLSSRAESYGDAQSFRPVEHPYPSDAHVFHYGHVREAAAYELKKKDFGRWWHGDAELAKRIARGELREKKECTVRYLGRHPSVMKDRIARGAPEESSPRRPLLVYGRRESLPEEFWSRVRADLSFTVSVRDILRANPRDVVLLSRPPFYLHLLSGGRLRSRVPRQMLSKIARPWTRDFFATVRFAEKGVSVD